MRLVIRRPQLAVWRAIAFGSLVLLLGIVCPYLSEARRHLVTLNLAPLAVWLIVLAHVTWHDDNVVRGRWSVWFAFILAVYVAGLFGWASISIIRFSISQFLFGWVVGFGLGWGLFLIVSPAIRAILNRVRRFPGLDECNRCGYSLAGLSVPRCPECGAPIDLDAIRREAGWESLSD
jgi:ribosomal protein L34E